MPAGFIQLEFLDALGQVHRAPDETIRAIERATNDGRQTTGTRASQATSSRERGSGNVLIVRVGETPQLGPAEIVLEDGTSLTIDRTLPRDVPPGYHQLKRRRGSSARLIIAPQTCYLPASLRIWGWAIQLYAARSRRSWGIGDLADLRWLARWGKQHGASMALVNPLASATPILPQQPSPYFPSSRRFRNPLYLCVEEIDGARETPGLAALARDARRLNRERLIVRDAVLRLKQQAFDAIWRRVRRHRDGSFDAFMREQGPPLVEYATFCALAERFGSGWHGWPAAYRRHGSPGVRRLAEDPDVTDRIRFHAWLQYQLDRQIARASREAPIVQDLPIGFDADGADAWAFQDVLAGDMSVGAPPDEFNTRGQNWGLPPFVPDRLRDIGYDPFIQTIRAGLRHAGGLRIDHVMGFYRLFWIPHGREPGDGAYVRNAAQDLLAIVALESHRARAVIVGEDLGTVEEEARAALMARAVLSYRLIWFERVPPAEFPEQALAAVTTHDLPTIAGLWTGSDLEAQRQLGLAPNEPGTQEIVARVRTLSRATPRTPIATVIARVHDALGRAPSRIVTGTLEDAMAVEERPNMPATGAERPNWSLALPRPIETLKSDPLAARIARALNRRRARRPDSRASR
jgi:4-alpha-glucanotransferase